MPIITLLFEDNKSIIKLKRYMMNTNFSTDMGFDHNLDN